MPAIPTKKCGPMTDRTEKHPLGTGYPAHLRGSAMRTFFRICGACGLIDGEISTLLGAVPLGTLVVWRGGIYNDVPDTVMERVGHVLGIYRALHTIFHEAERADGWLSRPNSAPLYRETY